MVKEIIKAAAVAFGLCLFGQWWGLPLPLHPDESVLQKFNIQLLRGNWDGGVYFSYGNLTQIFYLLAIWPAAFAGSGILGAALLLSRLASAFLAGAFVLFIASAAKKLWDQDQAKRTAWVAAALPATITYGHFGTADMPQLAGLAAGLWSALRLLQHCRRRDFFLTGIILGLTTALKYQGWLMAAPAVLVVTHLSRSQGWTMKRWATALLLGFSGLIMGFLIAMPWLWRDPSLALKWWLYNALNVPIQRGLIGAPAWISHLKNIPVLLGPVFLIPFVLGFARVCVSSPRSLTLTVLASAWLPFYLLTGSFRFTPPRFSLALLPALILYVSAEVSRWPQNLFKAVLALGFAFVLWLNCGFIYDSRFAAGRWLASQAAPGTTIELSPFTVSPPQGLLTWTGYVPPRDPLVFKPVPFYLTAATKRVMGMELALARDQENGLFPEPAADRFTESALEQRRPQFLALSDFYVDIYRYPRYAQTNPARAKYYLDLWDGRMKNYRLTWRHKFFPKSWWAPKPEFVDPEIKIFSRI